MKRGAAFLGIVLVGMLLTSPIGLVRTAGAAEPLWLSDQVPTVTKLSDLPDSTEPYSGGTDCVTFCNISTPIGTYNNGKFDDGVHGWGSLWWKLFFPSGNSGLYIYTQNMDYGYIYTTLSQSDLTAGRSQNGTYYTINKAAEGVFSSENSLSPVRLGFSYLAFSSNGEWMVTTTSDSLGSRFITVFNTKTYLGKSIARYIPDTRYNGGNSTPGQANLAVSDDGRYVASSFTQQVTEGNDYGLRIYDTTTCTDQHGVKKEKQVFCAYKNIWTGKLNGGAQYGTGIKEQVSGNPERPLNVRFKDSETITFSAVHDYVSTTSYKASTYQATFAEPAEPEPEKIRLLAMGDSYISGEGAEHATGSDAVSHYITGTNTNNNKCHLSDLSYPYLLGVRYAEEYHSVACSGAVMGNIVDPDHPNQLKNPVAQNSYNNSKIDEIIKARQVGTVEQLKYISNLEPNTILLSIGGNDIGFADIVERCVLSIVGNSCYGKRSERLSLLKTIYGKHKQLTGTYRKILDESPNGAKLYAVGYPQVINPTGNCGANVLFDDQERQFATLLIKRLNATLKNAAESVGAVYVDTESALIGHRLCDTDDDGVNGLTAGDDRTIPLPVYLGGIFFMLHPGLGNESYHPTALGHQLLAAAVANGTEDFTKKAGPPTEAGQLAITSNDPFVTLGKLDEAEVRRIIFDKIVGEATPTNGTALHIVANSSDTIAPNAAYTVVIHSQEVLLATGTADERGMISADVALPVIDPGIHSLHIYTTDIEGEPIDITQNIFIAASAEDYDGDGMANADDVLPLANETGVIVTPKDETQSEHGEAPSGEIPGDDAVPNEDKANLLPGEYNVSVNQGLIATIITQPTQASIMAETPIRESGVIRVFHDERDNPSVLGSIYSAAMTGKEAGADSRSGAKSDKRLRDWVIVLLSIGGICGVIVYLSKRSKI